MGDYFIVIKGRGAHHNQEDSTDANKLAKDLVAELIDKGHTLHVAEFIHSDDVIEHLRV